MHDKSQQQAVSYAISKLCNSHDCTRQSGKSVLGYTKSMHMQTFKILPGGVCRFTGWSSIRGYIIGHLPDAGLCTDLPSAIRRKKKSPKLLKNFTCAVIVILSLYLIDIDEQFLSPCVTFSFRAESSPVMHLAPDNNLTSANGLLGVGKGIIASSTGLVCFYNSSMAGRGSSNINRPNSFSRRSACVSPAS